MANSCDILLLQEHWFLEGDIGRIADFVDNVTVYGVSGVPANELLTGRPYGGCAIVINSTLKCRVSPVVSDCRRLYACILELDALTKFLLINVYFPCDDPSLSSQFKDVITEIESIASFHSDICHVILGGDLNTDFSRVHSGHIQPLHDMCSSLGLVLCNTLSLSEVDFTYSNDVTQARSNIDHFAVSENLNVIRYYCTHDGNNLSDHDPVLLHVSLNVDALLNAPVIASDRAPKCSWHRATQADLASYRSTLGDLLSQIPIPRDASNCVGCTTHLNDISQYHDAIVLACKQAATRTIPMARLAGRAGWNQHVETKKKEAIFWSKLWRENGCPRNGWVFEIRNKTRREYRRAARWVIRNQEKLKAQRMSDSLYLGRSRDFWSELRNTRRRRAPQANDVDGVVGEPAICEHFRSKYENLYNSVSYEASEMNELSSDIDKAINHCCKRNHCYVNHEVSVSDVKKAVSRMKSGKSDCDEGFSSDHIVNACSQLFVHLSMFLSMALKHQHVPQHMLGSVLVPIPKNLRKSIHDSNNYRSIAISSLIAKIFDNVILSKHEAVLCTSDLQFGFRPGHSTTQCTFVLQEITELYAKQKSSTFVTLLDASKAFDRVNYIKLFRLLLKRGFCPLVAKFMLSSYVTQSMRVRWQSSVSDKFSCSNGVKQGAVLSPVLFCIYMDELLDTLSKSNVGCYIGNRFAGALCYADDLTLLAPSYRAAKRLLSICEQFSKEYDVLFNSSKSVSLVFNQHLMSNCHVPDLYLHDQIIPRAKSALHLGNHIGDNSLNSNLDKVKRDIVVRINSFLCNFSYCDFDVLCYLFNTYCTAYYGAPLWDLQNVSSLSTFWRKCLRRLFRIPARTHSKYMSLLLGKDLLSDIQIRFINFFSKCLGSANPLVKICSHLCFESDSCVANNLRSILSCLNSNVDLLLLEGECYPTALYNRYLSSIEESDAIVANQIIELLRLRNGDLTSHLSRNEIDDLLEYLCVD